MGAELTIGCLVFPRQDQIDFTGPFEVFARLPGARCQLASVAGGEIHGDGGIVFADVARLSEAIEVARRFVQIAGEGTSEIRELGGPPQRDPA